MPSSTGLRAVALGGLTWLAVALAACTADRPPSTAPPATGMPSPSSPRETVPASPASPANPASPALGTVPPAWLGTRPLPRRADGYGVAASTPKELRHRRFTLPDTLPALPGHGFASRVATAPAEVLARSTWQPGCPVDADDLAWVRLTFRGFDDHRHTGELLVHREVADDVVAVFHELWDARFPLEQMRITTRAELEAAPTGDGNDTESFVCRPTTGASSYSQHAYGLAIDVDPFQNPYVRGTGPDRLVLPELSSSYLDRDRRRPGMIRPDGVVVRAFARIGWTWGGGWSSLKDYQHFSRNGR